MMVLELQNDGIDIKNETSRKLTDWGALITPVLYPNWNIPRTAEKMEYAKKQVRPYKETSEA